MLEQGQSDALDACKSRASGSALMHRQDRTARIPSPAQHHGSRDPIAKVARSRAAPVSPQERRSKQDHPRTAMLTSSLAGPTGGSVFIRRPTGARSIDDVSCRVCVEGQAITSVWRLDPHVVGVCLIALMTGAWADGCGRGRCATCDAAWCTVLACGGRRVVHHRSSWSGV